MMSRRETGRRARSLPTWGYLAVVVVYLALIQGIGLGVDGWADLQDDKMLASRDVLISMWIPLGVAFVFTYGVVMVLGWWRPVITDDRPVQRWLWFLPVVFVASILVATSYSNLSERGIGFTIALVVATQFVGWGEEGMFRGLGVVTLRRQQLTEGQVALWSSVIFGAVHLTNVISHGVSALPQAIIVSFAGYFFYLIRRVSHGNVLNSVLHGFFDFSILSATAIVADPTSSAALAAPTLVYLVCGIVLLVRRHRIELPPSQMSRTTT
jgi:hypothetical protein